jgi:hypothetical protein
MKRIIAALAVVVAAAAMASSAGATGIVYQDSGFACGIITPAGFVITENSSFVIYSSGKAVLKCTASDTGYRGPRVVTNPNNSDADCGYFSSTTGPIDLPFWKGVHGANGQSVLTCNGHVDLNAQPAPTARAAGATAGN